MCDNFLPEHDALLLQLKAGNADALKQFYELFAPSLYLNLVKLVKCESTAEDILQDVFTTLWEKREALHIRQSFKAYLFRAAENKVHDFFRKLKRDNKLYHYIKETASSEYTLLEQTLLKESDSFALQKAIATLPPQRKRIFSLCKIEGKSYQEVSRILGISTSTINDHIVKASRTVRDFMLHYREQALLFLLFLLSHKPF